MDRIFAKLLYEMEKDLDTVLVTIVADRGSAPRGAGSMMLVGKNGRILGTIGGGAVEARSEQMAMEQLEKKESLCYRFRLNEHAKDGLGMVCGGDVKVLFQYISGTSEYWVKLAGTILERIVKRQPGWLVLKTDGSDPALLDEGENAVLGESSNAEQAKLPLPIGERAILFGGGHCSQALAPVLETVGFRVTVFDDREEYANRNNFPRAEKIIVGDYTKVADYLNVTADDYVVVMTNGHSHDYDVQEQVLRGDFAYVGVIGSRKKTATVNQRLRAAGVPEAGISRVHTPIGMNIKAVTPEEIAVSIAGEMILERALRREATGITVHGCPMH